ncbi:MAG: hypothetical protein KAJ15_03605, partial [Spirochaetes bacterium]|nr:hypothetical protein [Spirochaetota bacterium]
MTKTPLMKPFKTKLLAPITVILLFSLTAASVLTDEDVAEESILAVELKKEVNKTHDFQLKVFVLTNPESKLQDIYIMSDREQDYDTETFINAIISAVNHLTTEIIAYRIYIGIVLIDINGELFAISAKNCREVSDSESGEEQKAKLNI